MSVCMCVCVCVLGRRGRVLNLFHAYYQWLRIYETKTLDHYKLRLGKKTCNFNF